MRVPFIAVAVSLAFWQGAAANPTGGTVTSGSATISQSGSTVTVTTTTGSTIINWQGFSIGAGETARFNQPSTSSTVLNRVTGPDASSIVGTLSSNGHIFLINPSGVVIAPGAVLDVASLVVSTMDLDDASFLGGNAVFTGSGTVTIMGSPAISNFSTGGDIVSSGSGVVATGGLLATTGGDIPTLSGQTVRSSGSVTLNSSNTLSVTSNTTSGITNWGSFNVGSAGTVALSRPGAGSVAVTAIATPSPSALVQGSLSRGGEVALNLDKREVPF